MSCEADRRFQSSKALTQSAKPLLHEPSAGCISRDDEDGRLSFGAGARDQTHADRPARRKAKESDNISGEPGSALHAARSPVLQREWQVIDIMWPVRRKLAW